MTACPATASTMTSRVIESNLHVNSEFAEQLDPAELSSVNELLDRIAALGVATDYNRIGLKTNLREINSPQVTHHVMVVEEHRDDPSPILKTSRVRATEPSMPDSRGGADSDQALNIKSGIGPDSLDNVPLSKLPNSETSRPLSLEMGRVPDSVRPTRPDICDLSLIRQEPAETVHHYWARFLLVMDRIKDCREENAISIFCNNCTDRGILNAVSHREITRFADLASIVRKYCAIESFRKTEDRFWDNPAPNIAPVRNKRVHYTQAPSTRTKKQKPLKGNGTVLEGWLSKPCTIHSTKGATPTHSLRACWIFRQVAKSGEELLAPRNHTNNTGTVSTVFETFASNNMRK